MKKIFALASLVLILGVTALAQTSAFSKGADCKSCCGNCDPSCCKDGCGDCCK